MITFGAGTVGFRFVRLRSQTPTTPFFVIYRTLEFGMAARWGGMGLAEPSEDMSASYILRSRYIVDVGSSASEASYDSPYQRRCYWCDEAGAACRAAG